MCSFTDVLVVTSLHGGLQTVFKRQPCPEHITQIMCGCKQDTSNQWQAVVHLEMGATDIPDEDGSRHFTIATTWLSKSHDSQYPQAANLHFNADCNLSQNRWQHIPWSGTTILSSISVFSGLSVTFSPWQNPPRFLFCSYSSRYHLWSKRFGKFA